MPGDVRHGRRGSHDLAEFDLGPIDLDAQFLQTTRNLYPPALIPEVPTDLPDDGRRRIASELTSAGRVVAVHRIDQSDHGDLGQVVNRLTAIAEPTSQALRESEVVLDGLTPQLGAVRRVLRQ